MGRKDEMGIARKSVDLHVHSHFSSDGFHSPGELFAMAADFSLKALVIADHDTLGATDEALELSKQTGIATMPALELSTISNNRMVHILGYGARNQEGSSLSELLKMISDSREEILPKIKTELEKFGFNVDVQRVRQLAYPGSPVITNFAVAILEDRRNSELPQLRPYLTGEKADKPAQHFIKDYLVAGAVAHVPEYKVDILDGVRVLADSGAVPIIAHPGEWFTQDDERILPELLDRGLAGMEVYTPYHNDVKEKYFRSLAEQWGLLSTGGSDYHSIRKKPGHEMGVISSADMEMYREIESAVTARQGGQL